MKLARDIGGTHLRVLGSDGSGTERTHRARREGMSPADLQSCLRELAVEWGRQPTAIGVSIAAVVSPDGRLLASENTGWGGLPLAHLLADAFGCPTAVQTDVFCGALYEARLGAARGLDSALCVGLGTGVGHALILGGKVWPGAGGGASGFGHVILDPVGLTCYCGNRGCLCQTASGRAQDGHDPSDAPLFALAHGIGIAVTLIEPEAVILSGGALGQPWFDLGQLVATVPGFSYPGARQPRFLLSQEPDANLRGALILASETA